MPLYTIIRVYSVPAEDIHTASERMMEAVALHTEKDYHVKDFIKDPSDKKGQGRPVDLRPTSWLKTLKEQLGLVNK